MSDFSTGDYKRRQVFSQGGRVSNTPDWRTRNLFQTQGGISNTPQSMLPPITGSAKDQTPSFTPPLTGTGMTNAQRYDALIRDKRNTGGAPTPEPTASDPYLDLLYGFMAQAGQGSGGANLSGYNASLKMLGKERKRMKARYKKYSNQIADIYGTLTGINTSMIADIAPAGEAMRADLAAQEGQQAAATRSADAARLAAATAARAELGLEDVASQYAGGDVATTQAEGMIKDSAANTTAAQNTLLANEGIAKQQLTNQNLGRALQEEASTAGLQRSLEDALAAIRSERVNVLNQRAQAASQGSGPNVGAQLEILDRIQSYTNPSVKGEPTPLDILESRNPNLGNAGRQAADTFAEWISNTANYEAIPAVKLGNKPSAAQVVGAFLTQTGQSVPAAQTWARNMDIYNLLVSLANTAK